MKALTSKQLLKIANGKGPTELRMAAIKELKTRPLPTHKVRNAIGVALLIGFGLLLGGHADAATVADQFQCGATRVQLMAGPDSTPMLQANDGQPQAYTETVTRDSLRTVRFSAASLVVFPNGKVAYRPVNTAPAVMCSVTHEVEVN